jgi:hypothetical protein
LFVANGSLRRKMALQVLKMRDTRHGWLLRAIVRYKELTLMTFSLLLLNIALVAMHDLELELDVNIAFLHGKLEGTIYMQQLEGFEIEGKRRPCLLIEEIVIWFEAISSTVV